MLALPASFYEKTFVEAPQSLLQACGEKISPTASYRYWVFATAQTSSGRYVALGGIIQSPGAPWHPNTFGALVFQPASQKPSPCIPISWPLDVFCTPSLGGTPGTPVGQTTLTLLATDAVRRYVSAFGSKAKFLNALHTQHREPDDPKLSFLATAVANAPSS